MPTKSEYKAAINRMEQSHAKYLRGVVEKYKGMSITELEKESEKEWTDKDWLQFYDDVLEYHKD